METAKSNRLGRGLDALLGSDEPFHGSEHAVPVGSARSVSVQEIDGNPYQPRKSFDEDELAQLSESIKIHGILQPLVVRQAGERYQLIAGERRLRAAQASGLAEVPVQVVDFDDQQILEAALVENIQRTDLNPIEKAQGFKDYLDRFGVTQEQLAARLGMDRTTISNLVNLLHLPEEVQHAVRMGHISLGHAKILKGLHDQERQVALCKEVMLKGLSVKALDLLVKQQDMEVPAPPPKREAVVVEKTAHVQGIEDEIRHRLAVKVQIRLKAEDKGQIVIGFDSHDDFERVMEALRR